jgi:hypothetical protein
MASQSLDGEICGSANSRRRRKAVVGAKRRVRSFPDFWESIDTVHSQIPSEPEITYEEFLEKANVKELQKATARSYVEDFNAARSDRISAQAVAAADRAASEIEGKKVFRLPYGYDGVIEWMARDLPPELLHLRSEVSQIRWNSNHVDTLYWTPSSEPATAGRKAPLPHRRAGENRTRIFWSTKPGLDNI